MEFKSCWVKVKKGNLKKRGKHLFGQFQKPNGSNEGSGFFNLKSSRTCEQRKGEEQLTKSSPKMKGKATKTKKIPYPIARNKSK